MSTRPVHTGLHADLKTVTDVDFSNQVAHDGASSHDSCHPYWHLPLAHLQLLHLPAVVKAKTALTSLATNGIMVVAALDQCFPKVCFLWLISQKRCVPYVL